jgi:hypothetical protein
LVPVSLSTIRAVVSALAVISDSIDALVRRYCTERDPQRVIKLAYGGGGAGMYVHA